MIDVRIEQMPPRRLLALTHTGPYETVGPAFERVVTAAGAAGLLESGVTTVGIYYDNPDVTPHDRLRSHAGVVVHAGARTAPDDFEWLDLPAGEFAIGTSLAFAAMQSVEEGYPVKMVIPSDGAGYELEASGLMASSKNKADAKRFLDWTLSASAASLYTKYKEIVTIPGVPQSKAAALAGLPADVSKVLYPMDFAKSAKERDAILGTWQKTIGR